MKFIQLMTFIFLLTALLSVSATSGWADDGHDRGRGDYRGGYGEWHNHGGDFRRFGHDDERPWGHEGFRHDEGRGWQRGFILDRRYHHDRYYPPLGFIASGLPDDYMTFDYDDAQYFFGGGIWYIDNDSGYVVVMPPYGIVVPVLPPYYTTIQIGGVPYYYANGVYYVWQPVQQGYVVSPPPPSSGRAARSEAPDQLYIYPEKGQGAKLQAKDRYECHRWAVNQTGYDPSLPPTNMERSQLTAKRSDYRRAIEACLDARGYSVK